jgi:hypothetical protein
MFGSVMLRCSGHQRPFWLTVALAVMLLVSVSIAHASPARLAADLRRDLDALRVQLEQIDPAERDGARQTITFNADLGEGGATFRRQSLVTMVAAAQRRLERLLERYRETGQDRRIAAATPLRLAMVELRDRVDRLARADTPAETTVIRAQVEATLDRSVRGLEALLAVPRG